MTVAPIAVVALIAGLRGTPVQVPPALLIPAVVSLGVWSAVYVVLVRRPLTMVLTLADAGVLGLLSLSAVWLVPLSWRVDGASWILPFIAFASVGHQYSAPRRIAVTALVGLTAATTAGAALARPPDATNSSVVSAVWSGAIGLLAAALWTLVRRAGERADVLRVERERAERQRDVAEAERRDQRAVAAALHDSAAATLLVVGLGDVPDVDRVATRAARDLEMLRALDTAADVGSDLLAELGSIAESSSLPVALVLATPPALPPAVSRALSLAAAEAVTNAARHSGAARVQVTLSARSGGVEVDVADDGRGFDPTRVGLEHRGVRESIVGRMLAIDGRATVESAAERGTTVRLRWAPPDAT